MSLEGVALFLVAVVCLWTVIVVPALWLSGTLSQAEEGAEASETSDGDDRVTG